MEIFIEITKAVASFFILFGLIFMGGYAAGGFWEDNDKR